MIDNYRIRSVSKVFLYSILIFLFINMALLIVIYKISMGYKNITSVYSIMDNIMLIQLLVSIAVAVPSFIYVIKNKIEFGTLLCFRKFKILDLILSVLSVVFFYPLIVSVNLITIKIVGINSVQNKLSGLNSENIILLFIVLAVAPAIFEEFQFRGLYYNSFKVGGYFKAAFISSIMFSFMHMNINQFMYTFILGMILSYIIEATGSILITMLIHFLFNSIAVVQIYSLTATTRISSSQSVVGATEVSWLIVAAVTSFALACACIGIIILRCIAKKNNKIDLLNNFFKGNKDVSNEFFNKGLILGVCFSMILIVYQLFKI